eukprot:NODE_12675_length_502_cov_34.970976_g12383_i0.p1 GENE.NODE_12675_length_502_cov_34.970976_g12383_i0~~NODE_12675_length_502_cov_34.970976_g12383_i0.p1  ORF type:complete len:119 (-),score=3.08 NODE_12675_length_502_cov_34.970976_g12383_i0:28-384(-)
MENRTKLGGCIVLRRNGVTLLQRGVTAKSSSAARVYINVLYSALPVIAAADVRLSLDLDGRQDRKPLVQSPSTVGEDHLRADDGRVRQAPNAKAVAHEGTRFTRVGDDDDKPNRKLCQ